MMPIILYTQYISMEREEREVGRGVGHVLPNSLTPVSIGCVAEDPGEVGKVKLNNFPEDEELGCGRPCVGGWWGDEVGG